MVDLVTRLFIRFFCGKEKRDSESDLLVSFVGRVAVIVRVVAEGEKNQKSKKKSRITCVCNMISESASACYALPA